MASSPSVQALKAKEQLEDARQHLLDAIDVGVGQTALALERLAVDVRRTVKRERAEHVAQDVVDLRLRRSRAP